MPSPARADRQKSLYVPSASVALGTESSDLLHVHGLAVTSVEVDLQLSMAGTFKFTIPNTFDAARAEFLTANGKPALGLLTLGKRVWIKMGYGDRSSQKLLLSGYITGVGTSFAEGSSPDLEVSGQDALYRLTLGNRELRVEKNGVQAAVAKVASDNDFSPKIHSPAPTVAVDCNLRSDMEFLRKIAEKYSDPKQKWEFFSRAGASGDTLYFRPRSTRAPEVGTLKWGADLLSFRPDASLGNQVSRVEVRSWDEMGKVKFLGTARAKGDSGGKAKTAAQIQQGFLSREVIYHVYEPVESLDEANDLAEAELARLISKHLTGEGETFGFPELLPDTRVKLEGLGAKFSRSYYVTKTVHTYSSSGYRTRFSIEEPDS